jgi:hypothetical protein
VKKNKAEQQAIERLVQETWMHVEHLNSIAERRPDLLIPIARKRILWPGFISRKRGFDTQNVKRMDRIELGANSDYSDREWRPDAAATHGANWVYWWGIRMAKIWRLPPLTGKNKMRWFDEAWSCMEKNLHITPETDLLLGPLGKSAKRDYKRENPKEREPLAMRAEIKRQIRKAFDTLILPKK